MFDAGGVEFDAGAPTAGLFAEAPDDPEPFPFETAALMPPITINARMTVRTGCRRNQLRFGAGWAGVTDCVGVNDSDIATVNSFRRCCRPRRSAVAAARSPS